MSFVKNGYFNVQIDGAAALPNFINIVIASVALLIHCIIGFLFLRGLRQNSQRSNIVSSVDPRLKALFMLSWICCILYCISVIIGSAIVILYNFESVLCILILVMSYYYFYWILLATLVLRLHISFKHSIYKMSSAMYLFQCSILSLWFGAIVFHPILYAMTFHLDAGLPDDKSKIPPSFMQISYGLSAVCTLLFICGSGVAVYYFVVNLLNLTRLTANSKSSPSISDQSLDNDDDTLEVTLNLNQRRLIKLSSRNVMLFLIATFSTIMGTLIVFVFNSYSGLRKNCFAIDSCINLWCLFLQFAFAQRYYGCWCRWCDRKCTDLITKKTKRDIRIQSIDHESIAIVQSLEVMESVDVRGSSASSMGSSYHLMEVQNE